MGTLLLIIEEWYLVYGGLVKVMVVLQNIMVQRFLLILLVI